MINAKISLVNHTMKKTRSSKTIHNHQQQQNDQNTLQANMNQDCSENMDDDILYIRQEV